jgi:hypothetical protein
VVRALPASSEIKRRMRKANGEDDPSTSKKRVKLDDDGDGEPGKDDGDDEYGDESDGLGGGGSGDKSREQSAIDITANFLYERLTPKNVADLVLMSLVSPLIHFSVLNGFSFSWAYRT